MESFHSVPFEPFAGGWFAGLLRRVDSDKMAVAIPGLRMRSYLLFLYFCSVSAFCFAEVQSYEAYKLTVIAGASAENYADGPGADAAFYSPGGTAVGDDGSIYIADTGNSVIRKLTLANVVSTFAGTAKQQGHVDARGADARFVFPQALAFDSHGNLLVADPTDKSLRSIAPDGTVSTRAREVYPEAICVDQTGTVYMAEGRRNIVSKVSPDGVVSIVAGAVGISGSTDGAAADARFGFCSSIAITPLGDILVGDQLSSALRLIKQDGTVSSIPTQNGITSFAFNTLGHLFATVPWTASIWQIGATGESAVFVGGYGVRREVAPGSYVSATLIGFVDGILSRAQFISPRGITFDGAGNAYITDSDTIRRISPEGIVTTLAGRPGGSGWRDGPAAQARFLNPAGIAAAADGSIYVSDLYGSVVRKISPDGQVTTIAGYPGYAGYSDGVGMNALLFQPRGLAIGPDGSVYVADSGNGLIRRIAPDSTVTTYSDAPIRQGFGINALARDNAGNLYCANYTEVWEIPPSGPAVLIGGTRGQMGFADGAPGVGRLWTAGGGLAVDAAGNVYVADGSNGALRKISPDRVMTTLAGGPDGGLDSTGGQLLSGISGLTIAANGDLIADCGRVVRTITPDGQVKVTDSGGQTMGFEGPLLATLTTAPDGTIYATDPEHQQVVRIDPVQPSRIVNLSIRGFAGEGAQSLIAGFGVSGSTTHSVLVRGIGPSLSAYSVTNVMPDPYLNIFAANGDIIAGNDNWGGNAALAAAFATSHAFTLPANAKDAAAIASMTGSTYTAQVSGTTHGNVLIEAYDLSAMDDTRFANLSARGWLAPDSPLIAGFTITGTYPKNVLVRGIGPTLAQFGVPSPVRGLSVEIFGSDGKSYAYLAHWDNNTNFTNLMHRLGAFPLPAGSADAAAEIRLPPGSYTAVARTSVEGGIALVEVYDADR